MNKNEYKNTILLIEHFCLKDDLSSFDPYDILRLLRLFIKKGEILKGFYT